LLFSFFCDEKRLIAPPPARHHSDTDVGVSGSAATTTVLFVYVAVGERPVELKTWDMGAVLEGLRSLDAYPKPDEEQSVKTVTGAVGKKSFSSLFGSLMMLNLARSFRRQPPYHAAALAVQSQRVPVRTADGRGDFCGRVPRLETQHQH
jgi:hypothetical protein